MIPQSNKYSDYKIFNFPDKLESLRSGNVTAPLYVRIKPINACDHKCYFCVYHYDFSKMHELVNFKDKLSKDKMFEILDDLHEMGTKAITYSGGGEPLIYPHIKETLQKTFEMNFDYSIITNGSNLSGEKAELLSHAKWVRVSMDYFDEASVKKSRKTRDGEFAKIITNIKNFAKVKKDFCDLSINFIIDENNKDNLYDIAVILKDAGVEIIRFSPVWTPDFYDYHKRIEADVKKQLDKIYSELNSDSFKVFTSYNIVPDVIVRKYVKCPIMQIIPVIGADYNVYACHNKAYDATGLVGSIKDKSFKTLWFSDQAKEIFNTLNPQKVCQHQCANDNKNIIITNILESTGDNFV